MTRLERYRSLLLVYGILQMVTQSWVSLILYWATHMAPNIVSLVFYMLGGICVALSVVAYRRWYRRQPFLALDRLVHRYDPTLENIYELDIDVLGVNARVAKLIQLYHRLKGNSS